mgnify:CR=1 FL=1
MAIIISQVYSLTDALGNDGKINGIWSDVRCESDVRLRYKSTLFCFSECPLYINIEHILDRKTDMYDGPANIWVAYHMLV